MASRNGQFSPKIGARPIQFVPRVTRRRFPRILGDPSMDAFREIYDRYYQDVRRFALFLTGDPAKADDLTADTFVRAWQARDRIRHATVKAYLLTITRNLYRDQLRSSRPILARQVELEDTLPDAAPGVDLHVQHASTLKDVK